MKTIKTLMLGLAILFSGPAIAAEPTGPAVDAVKAEILQRSKMSGTLDIFDSKIDKVRTLDLIEITAASNDKVTGQFRDTQSGDVVTIDANVDADNKVGEFTIMAAEPLKPLQEAKKDYTDQEVQEFIKEYIATQAAGTGTFMLFDEKSQKMRNLELVKLQDSVRRFGIIAIATAEFIEKDSGDTILADVSVENKEGLSVSAVRIKSVVKSGAAVDAK